MKKVLFLLFLTLTPILAVTVNPTAKTILDEMFSSIKNIRTLTYNLATTERINDKYVSVNSLIKINANPKKIYLNNPSKKLEVLFVNGENNNDAMVNPGKFPYVTLYLNPNKNLMHKNQHHSIHDLGFEYIAQLIKSSMPNSSKLFDKTFAYTGNVEWDGKQCYKIYSEFKEFKFIKYVVQEELSVTDVAKKFNCGEYRLVEYNNHISFDETIKKGTTLILPNMYASKTLMYIDKLTKLPIMLKVFDSYGLYEMYEFKNIQINKPFKPNEFTKEFNEYEFK